jgi:hypothetical protein
VGGGWGGGVWIGVVGSRLINTTRAGSVTDDHRVLVKEPLHFQEVGAAAALVLGKSDAEASTPHRPAAALPFRAWNSPACDRHSELESRLTSSRPAPIHTP